MNLFFNICSWLSIGIIIGFLLGALKPLFHRTTYTTEQIEKVHNLVNIIATILKYITFMLLVLGLIWCSYFLILGIVYPSEAEYANNIAELIVAILTIISILFAFVEFLRRK